MGVSGPRFAVVEVQLSVSRNNVGVTLSRMGGQKGISGDSSFNVQ
jgi:hypothetical protein